MIKKQWQDLAVFGGPPTFPSPLHVGTPNIGDRQRLMSRIGEILDSRVLTNHGPFVGEFERRMCEYLGVEHCIAMCNGTVALEIATRALGLSGEVIVPSMTFVATAHALQWQEITPVFCDIDPETHLLDPKSVEAMIGPRTTGIMGVHLWGRPCDTGALGELAERHGLKLVYDAAHAVGCTSAGQMVGNFGNAEVLSFHATKVMNSFEGGAVVTNDSALAEKIRLMTNFGFASRDRVIYLGVNGKMSEVQAAMGLTSLESLPDFVEHNRKNYHAYKQEFATVPGLTLREFDERECNNFQYIIAEIDERETGLSRDQMLQILSAENVDVRRYFYPGCHRMEPYSTYYPDAGSQLPQTERVLERVLVFPTGTAVGLDDVRTIGELLRSVVSWGDTLIQRLQA